jgi:plasmid stabilization system protein ParE
VRLNKLLDEKNVQNLSRTLDNLATASDSLREMPAILASMREALSESNLRKLRQILAHVEKTAGEARRWRRDARAGEEHDGLSRRFDQLAGRRRRRTVDASPCRRPMP